MLLSLFPILYIISSEFHINGDSFPACGCRDVTKGPACIQSRRPQQSGTCQVESTIPPLPPLPFVRPEPSFCPPCCVMSWVRESESSLNPLSTALDRECNIRRLMPDENDKRETVSNVDPARARRVFQRRRSPILCARLPRSVTFSLGAD